MTQCIDRNSGAQVQILPPSGIPDPRSFPVRQNERRSCIYRKYIFASTVNHVLVFFGMREVGVHRLQILCTRSLRWGQGWVGHPFVGIVVRTEFCDDRKRADDLKEYLTAERELASIVTDHGEDFQLRGRE